METNGAPSDPWPRPSWDLSSLTLAAFYFSPDLDLARVRVAVAEAEAVTAGARPNPDIGFHPEYVTNALGIVSPWILGFTFDLPIETAGQRGIRVAWAAHLTEAARLALAQAAWDVRMRVRTALVDHLLARREIDLARGEERVRRASLDLLEERLSAGEVSRPDVDEARTDAAAAALRIVETEGRVAMTRSALARAVGVPARTLDGVDLRWSSAFEEEGEWEGLDRLPGTETVSSPAIRTACVLSRLDLRAGLGEYAFAEEALRLEVAKQYPDIRIGPGYTFDQDQHKFGFGIQISLPIFNRNEGPIAEAEAHRREVALRVEVIQETALGGLDEALAAYRAAFEELAVARISVENLLRRRIIAGREALEAGEIDQLVLSGIEIQATLEARAGLEALRRAQGALGALEDVVQRPLDGTGLPPETAVGVESPRPSDPQGDEERGDRP